MAFRNLFGRKPPAPPPRAPTPPAPIALVRAPAYQPVPVSPNHPLDADVMRLWLAYQRQSSAPTWHGFVSELTTANAELAKQVARATAELADYRTTEVFTP